MHFTQRSPGINRKSRLLYPGPGFLSSATWPSMLKKHSYGLIHQLFLHFTLRMQNLFLIRHQQVPPPLDIIKPDPFDFDMAFTNLNLNEGKSIFTIKYSIANMHSN